MEQMAALLPNRERDHGQDTGESVTRIRVFAQEPAAFYSTNRQQLY